MFLRNQKWLDNLISNQNSDSDLKPLIESLSSGEEPDIDSNLSSTCRKFLRRIDKFELRDNVLVRLVNNYESVRKQVVVPRLLRPKILR